MEQHHPHTLARLLDILESTLSPEALEDLRSMKRHALLNSDLDLERYIVNRLIQGNINRDLLYADCHNENRLLVNQGKVSDKNIAVLAVLRLWERLQGGLLEDKETLT